MKGYHKSWLWIYKKKIISPHPLTNFEIQKYYQYESGFDGVINLDEYADVGTHWIAFYVKNTAIIYFDSLEYVPNEIEKFIGYKNIKTNIFRIQANNSVMCGYFCIGFIDFMFAGKTLGDYTNFFSPYDFKKNDNIILSFFKKIFLYL